MTAAHGEAPALPPPFQVVALDSVGSTNDEAKRLAASGAAHGTLVWALEQTSGRGRLDRVWASPRGNLYISAILRPAVPPARAAELGFVASLAVADLVAALVPGGRDKVRLKWPNDVLADGAKLSGILLEAWSESGGPVDWVVLGIGVNLASAPVGTPYPVTSFATLGAEIDVSAGLEALASALAVRLAMWEQSGFAPIRRDWLGLARGLDERLEIRHGSTPIAGLFRDLDADGALVLETEAGLRRITAGDVYFPGR